MRGVWRAIVDLLSRYEKAAERAREMQDDSILVEVDGSGASLELEVYRFLVYENAQVAFFNLPLF